MENIWMDATCPQSRNTSSANYSAILGGSGNSDSGYSNAFIAGSGIVLSATVGNPNSLHVNGLWANGVPVYPAGFPYNAGPVFSAPIGITPTAGNVLYIM